MDQYKKEFIEFVVRAGALKFGTFTLKSGRQAPYFFNAGAFCDGNSIAQLGRCYAAAAHGWGMEFDAIFGPAYKGIPLAVATSMALAQNFSKNVGYTFNRKEAKDHGEGGVMVGASLNETSRVLLIDDVITAGTAIRQSVDVLRANGNPQLVGILIAINRMEKNNEGVNALQAIQEEFGVPVQAIVNLDEIIEHLHGREIDGRVYIDDAQLELIKKYRSEFGV